MKLVGGLRYSTIGAVLIICFSQSGESRSQKVRQFDYYRKAFEWKFQIPTGRNYCFTNEMEEGEVLSFNFGVVQSVVGKNLTISFTLIDESDGSTLINVEGRDSVELDQIEVGKRNLELCFYNDRDRYHYKTVILYMSSSKPITWDDGMERELDELDMLAYNFKNSFDNTEVRITEAKKHMLKLRLQGTTDLALLENTYAYVNRTFFYNCALISLVSLLQVYFVRTLFEKKGVSGLIS